MYHYNEQDRADLQARRQVFQHQLQRYLDGKISDEEFRPIRLRQGLYVQRHAPMLRVAVPYGMLSSPQLRALAQIALQFDKGFCHISTRQNVQFNWIAMDNIAKALDTLAEVDMHSVQTSGDCIRNITSDAFAGVAQDELIDPRPYCELIRQWSIGHPEFAYLPRKFKIAITGAKHDRAMLQAHDIGLRVRHHSKQANGFEVFVGGGLGRTPVIGSTLSLFVPEREILAYLTAIIRVYNLHGRRDNKYKARIKILVKSIGIQAFKKQVDEEFKRTQEEVPCLSPSRIDSIATHFSPPPYEQLDSSYAGLFLMTLERQNPSFSRWLKQNTHPHKIGGYRSVTLSLKSPNDAPGDVSTNQLLAIASLADHYSFGVVRSTHEQNLVLADVMETNLYALWKHLIQQDLAAPTIGTIHDIICCPGLDYCSLANTQSLPLAKAIQTRFDNLDYVYDIGDLSFNISGCMNACAHHHLANIGILGVVKKGAPYFQITLGGKKGNESTLGKILGPSVAENDVPNAIEKIIQSYLSQRQGDEPFIDTYLRVGIKPFKEAVYGDAN